MPEVQPDHASASASTGGRGRRRRRLALGLVAFAIFMFGFAYINIPLFRTFCNHYGIGIAPVNAASTAVVNSKRKVTIIFSGEVGSGLSLEFHPRHAIETVPIGQREENFYTFVNASNQAIQFRAIHALYPYTAAENVAIIRCFCFSQQTLGPHKSRTLPVIYQINPGLKKDVSRISWLYTLFPVKQ